MEKITGDNPIALETYEAFGSDYARAIETNAWNAGYERPSTVALLPDVRGLKVLDAGCGPGIYAEYLTRSGALVTAVDVSPAMVALAKERVSSLADVQHWDLANCPLPFRDSAFDVVLSSLTIHYILDLDKLFGEFFRLLQPGGCFVFSTHHPIADYASHSDGNYYSTELVEEEWNTVGRPVKVRFYRRPMSALFGALLAANFSIETISEGRPSEDCRTKHPEAFKRLTSKPGFLFVRARKGGRSTST